MILSEYVRVNDIGWQGLIWMTTWILGILIIIIVVVLISTWVAAVSNFKIKIMPDFYAGKLRIALVKLKELSSENFLLKQENKFLKERLRVMQATWEGLEVRK